jgi:hypothetical protein
MPPVISGKMSITQLSPSDLKWVANQLKLGGLLKGNVTDKTTAEFLNAYSQFKTLNYLEFPQEIGPSTIEALAEIEGVTNRPAPKQEPAPKASEYKGRTMQLPHGMGVLKLEEPVTGCKNFHWVEFVKTDRVPQSKATIQQIIKIATNLEKLRTNYGGRSISITSGYRPPAINKAVGGVSNSRHILGDAVDITVDGISHWDFGTMVAGFWGNRGGVGHSRHFTHLDCRGYAARWLYGS